MLKVGDIVEFCPEFKKSKIWVLINGAYEDKYIIIKDFYPPTEGYTNGMSVRAIGGDCNLLAEGFEEQIRMAGWAHDRFRPVTPFEAKALNIINAEWIESLGLEK